MALVRIHPRSADAGRNGASPCPSAEAASNGACCLDEIDRRLIDGWQRGFPLAPAPFAVIAQALDSCEGDVIERLGRLLAEGILSRVGAVIRPNTAWASTLAALAVPPQRLEAVAAKVNAEPGVNHNYEREHVYNLWFVVAGRDRGSVASTLTRIEARTGLPVLDLPLRRAFHIDLAFPVFADASDRAPGMVETGPERTFRPVEAAARALAVADDDRQLLAALDNGLPLLPRPFRMVAAGLGRREDSVLADLRRLAEHGVVRRFGLVVSHRKLGFAANAMVVWDVPDEGVEQVAQGFTRHAFVTLCYERPRRGARWPYNLFCMIHGRDRGAVERQVEVLEREAGSRVRARATLFSTRCHRQRGARLSAA